MSFIQNISAKDINVSEEEFQNLLNNKKIEKKFIAEVPTNQINLNESLRSSSILSLSNDKYFHLFLSDFLVQEIPLFFNSFSQLFESKMNNPTPVSYRKLKQEEKKKAIMSKKKKKKKKYIFYNFQKKKKK